MTENDRLTVAPVFVIDLDVSSVFFSNCYEWHGSSSWMFVSLRINLRDAWLQRETTFDARFHRSKLRSDSRWQRRDARRTRCEPHEGAWPAFCCRRPTQRACPTAQRIPHRYRGPAECERSLR